MKFFGHPVLFLKILENKHLQAFKIFQWPIIYSKLLQGKTSHLYPQGNQDN
jgi:hypothetical protein